jgi:hypothetical protein
VKRGGAFSANLFNFLNFHGLRCQLFEQFAGASYFSGRRLSLRMTYPQVMHKFCWFVALGPREFASRAAEKSYFLSQNRPSLESQRELCNKSASLDGFSESVKGGEMWW